MSKGNRHTVTAIETYASEWRYVVCVPYSRKRFPEGYLSPALHVDGIGVRTAFPKKDPLEKYFLFLRERGIGLFADRYSEKLRYERSQVTVQWPNIRAKRTFRYLKI